MVLDAFPRIVTNCRDLHSDAPAGQPFVFATFGASGDGGQALWNAKRKAAGGYACGLGGGGGSEYPRPDSNLQPSAPEAGGRITETRTCVTSYGE